MSGVNPIRYVAELELLAKRLHDFTEKVRHDNIVEIHERSLAMMKKFIRAWEDSTQINSLPRSARHKTPRPE